MGEKINYWRNIFKFFFYLKKKTGCENNPWPQLTGVLKFSEGAIKREKLSFLGNKT